MELFSLALGGALGVGTMQAIARTREHRVQATGLADLLNWGFMVGDGVVLQKDGSLLTGWRFRGPDVSAATAEELRALSTHVNDALLPFTDVWMFHADAIRRYAVPYAPGRFPDPVTQAIDDERRTAYADQAGRQFETECYLVATRVAPPELFTRLGSLFVQGADRTRVDWNQLLGNFECAVAALSDRLTAQLAMERLGSDELMRHLHECLTGSTSPVRTPPHGSYLNAVLADQELVGGFEPHIGERTVRVVAVHGYPGATRPGQLDLLTDLPLTFRWSSRVIPIGTQAAGREIRRHQLQWFKKRKGAGAWARDLAEGSRPRPPRNTDDALWMDADARGMAQDASEAAAENASAKVRYCYCTQTVILSDPDAERARAGARDVLKALTDGGFTGRVETVNALDAYLGSLPGHGWPNLRRPLLSTRNIADLLPVTSVWPGLASNPSPFFPPASPPLLWTATGGATPFRVNLHDSDVGHALVVGRTGAGKSVLLAMLAAQFRRYQGARVFAFDVGYSLWALARAVGGQHYDLAAQRGDALRFQPLAAVDERGNRAWAADWLETLFTLQGVALTPSLRARIARALDLVAANARAYRTLTELAVHLQDETLVAALQPYTVGGVHGELLDSATDDLSQGPFQVFELKHLLALDDRIALPTLLYLFRRVEQQLDGRATLLLIDEAWMALTHTSFGAKINEWLLTLRKHNVAVVLATQSLSQLEQLADRHTIIDSCPTRFFLPDSGAETPAHAPLYRALGLNQRELTLISAAIPRRQYYFKSPRGSRLFELALGPTALAFVAPSRGESAEDTRRRIERLIESHDDGWPSAWLAVRGMAGVRPSSGSLGATDNNGTSEG
ncbi:MAG: conjugal transfer protein TrbE [Gemmatimonadaceae bacterium]